MTTLLPRTTPYRPRHHLDTIARTVGADLAADTAARRARDLIRDRVNVMRREDGQP
jgi:hypothetical protein